MSTLRFSRRIQFRSCLDLRETAGTFKHLVAVATCCVFLAGCGGRAYVHGFVEDVDIRGHSETQQEGPIRVSASVLGREEVKTIFGLDLYEQGIQPVWIEIENQSTEQVRYAPVGTDRFYFSPLEVAYTNRSGYSDDAQSDMERRFDRLSMPRYIDSGETRAGFVFTHADFGAKGFNVDLFGSGESLHFTFLLRVPGFEPDYARVDFGAIYATGDISTLTNSELYDEIKRLPCCSTDESGAESGDPINVVIIGAGESLLRAFLRSGWLETSVTEAAGQTPHFLFGRTQDAIFRYHSFAGDSFYELRLWLAPMMAEDERVWAGQVRHFFNLGAADSQSDPDVDNARDFALQNFMYGQALQSAGWIAGEEVAPEDAFWTNTVGSQYFSDGFRLVLRLSGDPVSLLEIKTLDWDQRKGGTDD